MSQTDFYEGGLDDGIGFSLIDPSYRYEIYQSYKNLVKQNIIQTAEDVKQFSEDKRVPFSELTEIIREFDENKNLRIEDDRDSI